MYVVARCECGAVCPSTSVYGAQTPYVCMPLSGMQFERFYSLNHSALVAWFANLYITGDFSQLSQTGETCVVVTNGCSAICPSTTIDGVQTSDMCISLIWDAVV
jgi:hypothetical protein